MNRPAPTYRPTWPTPSKKTRSPGRSRSRATRVPARSRRTSCAVARTRSGRTRSGRAPSSRSRCGGSRRRSDTERRAASRVARGPGAEGRWTGGVKAPVRLRTPVKGRSASHGVGPGWRPAAIRPPGPQHARPHEHEHEHDESEASGHRRSPSGSPGREAQARLVGKRTVQQTPRTADIARSGGSPDRVVASPLSFAACERPAC